MDAIPHRGRTGTTSSVSLSRLLTDATDSEFLPTETEAEAEEEDLTAVPEVRRDQLRLLEQLGYGQFGEVCLNLLGSYVYLYL